MMEIQGKSILVRVSARFELARVRVIGSRLYISLRYRIWNTHLDKQTLGTTKKTGVIKEQNLQTSVLRPMYLHVHEVNFARRLLDKQHDFNSPSLEVNKIQQLLFGSTR